MTRKLIKVFLAILFIGIVATLIFLNLPKASVGSRDVDFSINSEMLFDEFKQNENAANRKYIGKVIEVYGTVLETQKDKNGATVVILKTNDPFNGILCTLESGIDKNFKEGQLLKVKGICTGKLMDVVLNKCTIQ